MLILEGADEAAEVDSGSAQRALAVLLDELPLKQAVDLAAKITGGKKNELYKLALELKKGRESVIGESRDSIAIKRLYRFAIHHLLFTIA